MDGWKQTEEGGGQARNDAKRQSARRGGEGGDGDENEEDDAKLVMQTG